MTISVIPALHGALVSNYSPGAPRKTGHSRTSTCQAAALVGWTSKTLPGLAIGIARGFIASGSSRTRSTCSSPLSSALDHNIVGQLEATLERPLGCPYENVARLLLVGDLFLAGDRQRVFLASSERSASSESGDCD